MIPVKPRKTSKISTVTKVSTEAQKKTQKENWAIFCLKGMIGTVNILVGIPFTYRQAILYSLREAEGAIKDLQMARMLDNPENKKGRIPK